MDMLKVAKAIVQSNKKVIFAAAALAVFTAMFGACSQTASNATTGTVDPNETAAKVNGKTITMQEVDRAVKQQAQGQESKLSPLELAGARLQVLQTLVEQEVMFQKAEKESAVPSEEEVTAEVNKQKVDSHLSAEEFNKQMTAAGLNEAAFRDGTKKALAIKKLQDKITGKIEPPKDSEIEAFYAGNKESFVKKKGVKLAAIIIDPSNSGEGDVTTDEPSAVAKANEIINQLKGGAEFATVAREKSEDQSRFQGGDLGYISEEDLKQAFPAQTVAGLMNPSFQIGQIVTSQAQGKYFILKLQERSDRDEAVTLETPGIRQQVTDSLINARKQLLQNSYQAMAMNEAKIENFLAKKVVDNPNELSGARPAGSANITNTVNPSANTSSQANANSAAVNANANANANTATMPKANAAAKPATNVAAKPAPTKPAPAKPVTNAPANK